MNGENAEDAEIDNGEEELVLFPRPFNFANDFIDTLYRPLRNMCLKM